VWPLSEVIYLPVRQGSEYLPKREDVSGFRSPLQFLSFLGRYSELQIVEGNLSSAFAFRSSQRMLYEEFLY